MEKISLLPIRDTLIFYTSATCNLCCSYCYIDKNPILQKIDKMLENSFADPTYYFDFSKKVIENKEQLKRIEFWGGETSQGLHRTYKLIQQLVDYYPNLDQFFMSTNFTTNNWFDEFYGFLKILEPYHLRKFIFTIQLSIDGPEYINDKNRGNGVTKKWIEHYQYFCQTIDTYIPDNVSVVVNFKPTLSNEDFQLLSTKEKIKEYYKFLDDFLIYKDKYVVKQSVTFNPVLPTMVSPGPYTKEDGQNFANFCKLSQELEKEDCFKYYKCLVLYRAHPGFNPRYTLHTNCNYCGSGLRNIGLLPDNYVSLCHMGFTQLLEEYKIHSLENHVNDNDQTVPVMKDLFIHNKMTQSLCIPFDELEQRLEEYKLFYENLGSFQILNTAALIRILAAAGQIESKFNDEILANKAAHYIYSTLPICIRDNMSVTGTLTMLPMEGIKLLLNGATEYLVNWDAKGDYNGKNLSR